MISTNDTVDGLITAGYLHKSNKEIGRSVLDQYQKTAAGAVSAKRFALEDKTYQAKVVHDALELAETDLEMDQIEDRFIQAEVIDQAVSLSAKDDALFEKADAMLVTACEEAALALSNDGLVDSEDLEAVTRLIAGLWNITMEDKT